MSTTPGSITMRGTEAAEPTTAVGSAPLAVSAKPIGRARLPGAGRKTSRSRVVIGLSAAVVLVLGAWWARGGPEQGAESVTSFTVTPRVLPIILREKGELKAKSSVDIKCEIEGRTRILSLVEEGQIVKKGDLLVELASDKIEEKLRAERLKETSAIAAHEAAKKEYEIQLDENASNIRKGELAVTIAQLNLEKYKEGDWSQQLQEADLGLKRAEAMLSRTRKKLVDSEKLAEKNFISQLELDDDRFSVYESEIALKKAQLGKQILEKYTYPVELQQKEADLREAQQELERTKKSAEANASKRKANMESKATELDYIQQNIKKYEEQLAKCRIAAPSDGFVVYYNEGRWYGGENQIREGAEVHERQTILTIPDPSVMTVTLRIHEAKVDRIEVEQKALIEVEGVPGESFAGRITKIAMLADSRNRWLNPDLKEYETEITLDPCDIELKPGATAHVEIQVDHLEDVLAIPVQSIFSKGGQSYVFLEEGGGQGTPVPVELGASNSEYVEVCEGLESGQTILLAVADELKRLIPEAVREDDEAPVPPVAARTGQPGRDGHKQQSKKPKVRQASATVKPDA